MFETHIYVFSKLNNKRNNISVQRYYLIYPQLRFPSVYPIARFINRKVENLPHHWSGSFRHRRHYVTYRGLDGLDNLDIAGEDDGQGDDEAKHVDEEDIGDVKHWVNASPIPFNNCDIKADTECLA